MPSYRVKAVYLWELRQYGQLTSLRYFNTPFYFLYGLFLITK